MGQIILCETKEAENTYRFSSFHQEISTYEELCYYIREYFIFFVEEEIPESLVMWISSELGIRDLEQEWDRLSTQKEKLEKICFYLKESINYNYRRMASPFFFYVSYFFHLPKVCFILLRYIQKH